MPGTIRLVDPQGEIRDVPTDAAAGAIESGWRMPSTQEELGRVTAQAREEQFGGVGGQIKAGLAGAARGLSLGGSDVLARAIGGDDAAIVLEGLRETNPVTSTLTEVGGALAPALVTGGAALPPGAASRLGAGIARAGEGAGALARIGRAAAGGAAEGALFGAGQGVSELALSTDPLTVERVASAISSNALYGAALGGPLGALGKGAEIGLARAKGAIDGALERRLARATTPDEAIETGELHLLDTKHLKNAREKELAKLDEVRAPERQKLVDEIHDYRDRMHEAEIFKVTGGTAEGDIRELGGSLKRADKALRNALDNKTKLSTEPERIVGALQQQEQAMSSLMDWGERNMRAVNKRLVDLDQEVRADLLDGRVKGYVPTALTARGMDLAVERESQRLFEQIMAESKRFHTIQDVFPGALERNRELQQRIGGLAASHTSDRLSKIDEALEALAAPKAPSLGAAVLSAAAPFAGPIGVAAAAGNRVLGSFKKLAEAATVRAGKAASSFLGIAGKAAAKSTPYLPVLATKTLAAVRYAEDDEPRSRRPEGAPKEPKLHELYEQRTNEVKRQVHLAADGTYQMRPAARQKMAAAFDGIRTADPILADRLEEQGARKIEYLATILPRLPDYGTIAVGPERRRVSELQMRAWARSAAALEDPLAVFDRAGSATESGKPVVGVTVEDAAAIRAVYPGLLAEFTTAVAQQLPTLRKTLPFTRRLGLSILTGVPVDPAMTPGILRQLQSMHEAEPGTEGGTQPAVAQAQFGSVSRKPETDSATPAQRRQQGAA